MRPEDGVGWCNHFGGNMPQGSSLTMKQSAQIATITIQTIDPGDLHQLNVILEQSVSCMDQKCDELFCVHMTLEVQFQMQVFARIAAILASKLILLPSSAEVLGRPALGRSQTLPAS
jgi:hypothetical protein